jgi:hypothetical protein
MSDDVIDNQQEPNNVEPQQTPNTPDYAAEAGAQGWVAKEDYRGNESDWVDAETFVRRGKEIMPILRKNNEKLLKELKEARSIAEEARSTAREFQKFQKEQYERKAKDLEGQLVQLKQAKRDAVSSGDGDRVVEIDDAMDLIKQDVVEARAEATREPTQAVQSPPQPDENLQAWLDRNDWFGQDKRITDITNTIGKSITEEFPTLKGKAFLDKLDEELATTFPERFGKKKRSNPMDGSAATTTSGRPSSAKKSYENLPTEAKAACDRFLKQGLIKSKEAYVAEYDWSE